MESWLIALTTLIPALAVPPSERDSHSSISAPIAVAPKHTWTVSGSYDKRNPKLTLMGKERTAEVDSYSPMPRISDKESSSSNSPPRSDKESNVSIDLRPHLNPTEPHTPPSSPPVVDNHYSTISRTEFVGRSKSPPPSESPKFRSSSPKPSEYTFIPKPKPREKSMGPLVSVYREEDYFGQDSFDIGPSVPYSQSIIVVDNSGSGFTSPQTNLSTSPSKINSNHQSNQLNDQINHLNQSNQLNHQINHLNQSNQLSHSNEINQIKKSNDQINQLNHSNEINQIKKSNDQINPTNQINLEQYQILLQKLENEKEEMHRMLQEQQILLNREKEKSENTKKIELTVSSENSNLQSFWIQWLTQSGLEHSAIQPISQLLAENQLTQDDLPSFDHDLLKSLGPPLSSIAKYRLVILKNAKTV